MASRLYSLRELRIFHFCLCVVFLSLLLPDLGGIHFDWDTVHVQFPFDFLDCYFDIHLHSEFR